MNKSIQKYFWLQPAAPAAIAVFRMVIISDVNCFSQSIPAVGAARFALLQNMQSQAVDEVVLMRIDQQYCDVHCHGGVGIRAAVDAAMQAHGYQLSAVDIDQRWQELSQLAHPAALPLINDWQDLDATLRAYCMRQPIVLITGPANAGKSTLLNAWCGHQRALVSDRAGTTRDLIAACATMHGWTLRVIDSAGLRESDDELELAGQELVERARGWADVVVYMQPYGNTDQSFIQENDIVVHAQWDGCSESVQGEGLRWSAEPWNSAISSQQQLQALTECILDRLALPYAEV